MGKILYSKRSGWRYALAAFVSCMVMAGCDHYPQPVQRENLCVLLKNICADRYQAQVVCKAADETIWVYLAYATPRSGRAAAREDGRHLYLEYTVASFNPYRTVDPPELKFVVQKILTEIRRLLLRASVPYRFFVLVVTDVTDRDANDQWYMGYTPDLKPYAVAKDFSGEGYNRLAWHVEPVASVVDAEGRSVSGAYLDIEGAHIRYHDVTLKEFVEKQITWRIYKRFTIEYNKTPFDVTSREKLDEVLSIVKTVFMAYNFNEVDMVYLKDSSPFKEKGISEKMPTAQRFEGYGRQEILKYKTEGIRRRPVF